MGPRISIVAVLVAMAAIPSFAQGNGETVNIPGTLELVDKPLAATSVEYLSVTIHELHRSRQNSANPDREGRFVLNDVVPGRYSLNLPFPGRIRLFTGNSKPLMADGFDVPGGEIAPLHIVVSLKTSALSVDIVGLPEGGDDVVALLSRADAQLTIRDSSILNRVSGHETQFRFVPPGSYTLAVLDSGFSTALTSSVAVRNALRGEIVAVEVREDVETRITAPYITADTVQQAIGEARGK